MSELENTVKNLEICRLCLNLTVVKVNIFTDDFAKMIEILTSLKIRPDDSLPKVSCLKCARDVKSAFLVRRRIIQSHGAFHSKINRLGLNNRQISTNTSTEHNRPSTSTENSEERTVDVLRDILSQSNNSGNIEFSEDRQEDPVDNINDGPASENGEDFSSFAVKSEGHPSNMDETNNEDLEFVHVEPQIHIETGKILSTDQVARIQKSKLELNTKYLNRLKSLETHQKLNAWKLMNKKDQMSILKWMEKRKLNSRKFANRLVTNTTHKKREPLKMYCTHCQVKFTNKITYKNHMTRHKHKTCPVCNKQIRSAYLKRHMTLHEDAPVICEICGQTCKNACSLRMHFFYYHKNPNFCVCEDCGRSFRTKTKLLYHQRKDHTKERNFKCETCGKSFFLKMYLTKHINMKHMKLRPHICEYCGKGFSGKHALRTHVRQHTNEAPYQCNFCGMSFRQRVSLRGHLKSRHKVEEEIKFFCDSCGKGFASEVALDVHSRLHTEIKCPWCSDTFAEKIYLEQHVNTEHPNANEENINNEGDYRWLNL